MSAVAADYSCHRLDPEKWIPGFFQIRQAEKNLLTERSPCWYHAARDDTWSEGLPNRDNLQLA